jgi:hypothetical protein
VQTDDDDDVPEPQRRVMRHLSVLFVGFWVVTTLGFGVYVGNLCGPYGSWEWSAGLLLACAFGSGLMWASMSPVIFGLAECYSAARRLWRRYRR